ncbi:MAG: PilZ domain-containing protein [Deltaproteobacteria bacterium]|nr:PilZ domain-containing protein [Deltaproteobacteria bacterium]
MPYGAWVEGMGEGTPCFYLAQSLSLHGLKLLAANDHAPRVGEPVQLRLLVENETRVMAIQGKVVNVPRRVEDGKGASFSIRFTELDEDNRLFLTDLYDEACGF